jgi:hypothetical protein
MIFPHGPGLVANDALGIVTRASVFVVSYTHYLYFVCGVLLNSSRTR